MNDQVLTADAAASAGSSRRALRFALAALAALVGVVYFLIALQVVHVADTAGKASPFLPMAAAGAAFVLGAVLVVLSERRLVYLLGAAVQVIVLIGYFAVAPSRDPHYEAWGMTMKLVQLVMLGLLVFLALKPPSTHSAGP